MVKRILATIGIIVAVIIIIYTGLIVLHDPLANKENEMPAIEIALEAIDLESISWQTIIFAASGETNASIETVWEIYSDLEAWNEWSVPLHISSEWTGDTQWEIGSTFTQDLDLGILGQNTSPETITHLIENEMVMWCKDENGLQSCHIWQFTPTAEGGTQITNVEIFHGVFFGLLKPIMISPIQERFQLAVDGLIALAEEQ